MARVIHYGPRMCRSATQRSRVTLLHSEVTCKRCLKMAERPVSEQYAEWWDSGPFERDMVRLSVMEMVLYYQKRRERTGEGSPMLEWYDAKPMLRPATTGAADKGSAIPEDRWMPVTGSALGFAAIMLGEQCTIRYADAPH